MNSSEKNGDGPLNGISPDQMHDLFTAPENRQGEDEDPLAALRNDPNYAALISELEYIAKQARALFEPAQEAPRDEVWDKIQKDIAAGKLPDA